MAWDQRSAPMPTTRLILVLITYTGPETPLGQWLKPQENRQNLNEWADQIARFPLGKLGKASGLETG
jgi:hypothetical protein